MITSAPAIQDALDDCEEWIDFAFQAPQAPALAPGDSKPNDLQEG